MLILQTITGEQHRVKDTTYIWWYMLQDQMSIAPLYLITAYNLKIVEYAFCDIGILLFVLKRQRVFQISFTRICSITL